jgi:novobiocin biosynthesis protein NovU/D-mycarose 3-C-methyltransferase
MEGIYSGERIDLAIPCLLCQEFKVERAISFPKTPLANTLPDVNRKQNIEEEFYPIDLGICGSCGHIQLTHIVPPDTLFKDYPYLSNSNSQTSSQTSARHSCWSESTLIFYSDHTCPVPTCPGQRSFWREL